MAAINRRAGDGRGSRRFRPEVAALEGRALQTVAGGLTKVYVHPGVLPPTPSGRPVPVQVYGVIASNRAQTPLGRFFVTDEYREFEPAGPVALTPSGSQTLGGVVWHDFTYSFTINFPTKRSTKTPDGRHYSLFVGANDGDGTGGTTVQVLVPKVFRPTVTGRKRSG